MVKYYETITLTVGAGATAETTWAPETDVVLHSITATERGGASLDNVHLQLLIANTPIMRPSIPMSKLGDYSNRALPININVAKGETITFKVTNNTGSSVTVDITLRCD